MKIHYGKGNGNMPEKALINIEFHDGEREHLVEIIADAIKLDRERVKKETRAAQIKAMEKIRKDNIHFNRVMVVFIVLLLTFCLIYKIMEKFNLI